MPVYRTAGRREIYGSAVRPARRVARGPPPLGRRRPPRSYDGVKPLRGGIKGLSTPPLSLRGGRPAGPRGLGGRNRPALRGAVGRGAEVVAALFTPIGTRPEMAGVVPTSQSRDHQGKPTERKRRRHRQERRAPHTKRVVVIEDSFPSRVARNRPAVAHLAPFYREHSHRRERPIKPEGHLCRIARPPHKSQCRTRDKRQHRGDVRKDATRSPHYVYMVTRRPRV